MSDGGTRRPRVAVVGAGVGGAAAAWELSPHGVDVLVLESAAEVGGKLRRTEVAGVTLDVGAEAVLARRPEAVALAREVGLGDRVVHPATASAGVWTRDRVRALPPTVMGVPADLGALRASGILSAAGLLRAGAGRAPRLAEGEDAAVGDLVARAVGREVRDRLLEPLLGGVYAGRSAELSVRAAAPQVLALLQRRGWLVTTAARTLATGRAVDAGPVFAGLEGGVAGLVPAALEASGARVRTGVAVRELRRTAGGWALVCGSAADPELVEVDGVVVAAPAAPTARLLSEHVPAAARRLRAIDYASMAVVTLAVPSSAVGERVRGSGFLVPPVDGRVIKAATYTSRKWGWVGERAAALAEPVLLLRTSIGRRGDEADLQRPDDELVALAMADLGLAVGLRGPLVDAHVQRWGGALPQYAVGHLDRVAEIRAAVAEVAGLDVCGAAYDGVGVPAVVAGARAAAARVVADVTARPSSSAAGRMAP